MNSNYKETVVEQFTEQDVAATSPSVTGSQSYKHADCNSSDHSSSFRHRRLSYSDVHISSSTSLLTATPNTAKSKALSMIAELDFDLSQRTTLQETKTADMKQIGFMKVDEKIQGHSLSGNKRKLSSLDGYAPNEATSVRERHHSSVATRTIHATAPPIPESPSTRRLSPLYHGNPSPHPKDTTYYNNHSVDAFSKSTWKKLQITKHNDAKELPFPREVAGLYSCYGIEPLSQLDLSESVDDEYDEVDTVITSKINQDRGGIARPYGNCPKSALFAVYDGHGDGGENIAQFSLSEIQRRLELHPDFHRNISRAFKDTFLAVNKDLSDEDSIEPYYSGSTACVVLLRSNILTTANAGDSRAVVGRRSKTTVKHVKPCSFQPIDLSIDQNPDSPGEMERILRFGGFVSPPPEPGLSSRVWLDRDFTKVGLAMARSIGDYSVKSVGVIADPVVSSYNLTDQDEFLILATDGVWEFLSSQNAVDIVGSSFMQGTGASAACQRLIEVAAEKWHENEGVYRDDITAIVIHLKGIHNPKIL